MKFYMQCGILISLVGILGLLNLTSYFNLRTIIYLLLYIYNILLFYEEFTYFLSKISFNKLLSKFIASSIHFL